MSRTVSLQHLQAHLPWTIPYTQAFSESNAREGHRNVLHDLMHVMKSMGKLAAMCERRDHGTEDTDTNDARLRLKAEFSTDLADLVICALHMANANPWTRVDLGDVVARRLEERNKVKIPPEERQTLGDHAEAIISEGMDTLKASLLKALKP